MKTVDKPAAIFLYEGKLVQVIGIINARAICMRYLQKEDMPKCSHCGEPVDREFVVIESSPLFQKNAQPVNTLEVK
jgi:hypothetical protein